VGIINAAAVVGGIEFNMCQHVATLEDNLRLATSVVRAAHEAGVQSMVSVLSTCIFPVKHQDSFDEAVLEDGAPCDLNAGYAHAKRMLFALCKAYHAEHGRNYVCITPPNLYGPHDKFDHRAHVVGALIRKFYDAEHSPRHKEVVVFGSGRAQRQFLFCEDMARLLLWALESYTHVDVPLLVLGDDAEVTIRALVDTIAVNFSRDITVRWDATKPDGQLRKRARNTRMRALLPAWTFEPLDIGIAKTVEWYRAMRAAQHAGPQQLVPAGGCDCHRHDHPRRALVIGATGQDGCYLLRLLLSKGYTVFGTHRRSSTTSTPRIEDLAGAVTLLHADLTDEGSICKAVQAARPDEVYNLGAQSHVGLSFDMPIYTGDVDALGVARVLQAVLAHAPHAKLYHASTSELFGAVPSAHQTIHTSFCPVSPYGIAKHYAYQMVRYAREAHGLFAVNGVLFNHESEMRGHEFVTRKVTLHVARWWWRHRGGSGSPGAGPLRLGNLGAKRDWGHAEEYVHAMWALLQASSPRDACIGTGTCHTVREFVDLAFRVVGAEVVWEGEGPSEVGKHARTGEVLVVVDPTLYRPLEVDTLCADPTAVHPCISTSFTDLVLRMVHADCYRVQHGLGMYAFVDGRTHCISSLL
jgi:GDPmannose 4,6-dehydratase